MGRGLRFPTWAKRSEHHTSKLRQGIFGLSPYHRRLVCEPLEDRRLLSIPVSGVISQDTTWYAANGTYNLTSSVYVEKGAKLTIEPGVQVQGDALYVNDSSNTGGALSANNVNFQNQVELYANAVVSLSGAQFLSGKLYVAPQLATSLVNSVFQAGSTVNILGGTLTGPATIPAITNVSNYDLWPTLYVESGGSLTIAGGNTITDSGLYINDSSNTGGALSANNVNFQNQVELYANAVVSLSGAQFLSGKLYVAPQLATSLVNSVFQAGSTVNILGGTLTGPATIPAITNVSNYDLWPTLYVESGGSLTIASGNTITDSGLYVNDSSNTGGALSANNVNFQNQVELYANAVVSLSGAQFLSGKLYVAPQLATSLVNSVFQAGSTVNILGGTLTGPATIPAITNVSNYDLWPTLYVESGGSLTIAGGNTITDAGLYINDSSNTGGALSANNVNFQNQVELYANAVVSLSGAQFLSGKLYVAPQLATSLVNSVFQAGSTVNILGGTLTGPATIPAITNVSNYDLWPTLYVESGGSLTIASGNTITDAGLYISDDGSGGALAATGVTFKNQVTLGPKSDGVLEFDTFNYTDYEYFDGQMQAIVTNNNFSGAKARAEGTVGPTINLEGNYWGTTDVSSIRQNRIYDYYTNNNHSVPVIDYSSPLAAPPVQPVAPSKLAFTTAAQTLAVGVTSGTITVQLDDASGNPVVAGSAGQTVNLTTTSATGTLPQHGRHGDDHQRDDPGGDQHGEFQVQGHAGGNADPDGLGHGPHPGHPNGDGQRGDGEQAGLHHRRTDARGGGDLGHDHGATRRCLGQSGGGGQRRPDGQPDHNLRDGACSATRPTRPRSPA